jgi:hypothetical protein
MTSVCLDNSSHFTVPGGREIDSGPVDHIWKIVTFENKCHLVLRNLIAEDTNSDWKHSIITLVLIVERE